MPKYYEFMVCGYFLYFTSHCTVEAMHVHASGRKLTEAGSAKFFVKSNGDTVVQHKGILKDKEITTIQAFIKDNSRRCTYVGARWARKASMVIDFLRLG